MPNISAAATSRYIIREERGGCLVTWRTADGSGMSTAGEVMTEPTGAGEVEAASAGADASEDACEAVLGSLAALERGLARGCVGAPGRGEAVDLAAGSSTIVGARSPA